MKQMINRTAIVTKKMLVFMVTVLLLVSMPLSACSAGKKDTRVGCRVEIDRTVIPADTPQKAIVKITLEAPQPPEKTERPAVNLAIVLDKSGSMSGQKIEKAKEAAIEALRRLSPQDIFSLVVYDQSVQTIVPAQNAINIVKIESRIRQIGSGGSTALFGGVSQGAAEVRKNTEKNYVHRIILLSDGLANVGPSSPEDLGRLGAALIKEGISVSTVGVGTDYNEDLMARLSQNSDGNIYFVESSVDLPRIFTAELGDVLNVVAQKVHVTIECPDGVKPVTIIGRDGRIKGNMVELSLNQLYGGQEKYALVEVEVPAGKSGNSIEIARASVSYDNPFTKKQETSTGRTIAQFSHDRKKVKASGNIDVQKEMVLNRKALAQDKAIELTDQGKQDEAAQVLRDNAYSMEQFGASNSLPQFVDEARELNRQAEVIEKEGMSKKNRKKFRNEAYEMKQQQPSSSVHEKQ